MLYLLYMCHGSVQKSFHLYVLHFQKESGKFEEELIKICPSVKAGDVKESLQEHIIDFYIEFANDSGNVPAC